MVTDLMMVQSLLQEGNVESALDIINELLEIHDGSNEQAEAEGDSASDAPEAGEAGA
jgi:pentatricopeptide repeat protein